MSVPLLSPAGVGLEVKLDPEKAVKVKSGRSARSWVFDMDSEYLFSISVRVPEYRLVPYL